MNSTSSSLHPQGLARRSLVKGLGGLGGLAGLGALGLAGAARAATPEQAWRSSYAPFDGPLKPALQTQALPVQGRWPAELRGTLYRTGPARRQLGGVSLNHFFDGDGMLQAFRCDGRRVTHRGVMLATPKLQEEEAAGRLLYSGFGSNIAGAKPLGGPDSMNPANINLLPLAGEHGAQELYALWEAGSALKVDPVSLQAQGFKTWSPETQGAPFSAHPRVARDGTVWSFGYLPGSGRLVLYEISPQGRLRRQQVIEAPQADMVHDFAITERYLVFLLMPLKFTRDVGPEASFLQHYRWDAAAPMIAMLVDKADLQTVLRFELPATGVFHLGNAFEQGGAVHVGFAAQPAILNHMQGLRVDGVADAKLPPTQWTRLKLDLASGRATSEQPRGLDDVEFPRIDPRHCGQASRFTVMLQRSPRMHAAVNGLDTVLTLHGERVRRHAYGDGWIAEEHVFVPRSRAAREGDGWLLGTAYHWPSERTALSVFDAQAVDAGPLARVRLPYGLPLGLHGQFVSA